MTITGKDRVILRELASKLVRKDLEVMRGCAIEVIMKDVSTYRGKPHCLWEWAKMAVELAEECA